MTQIIEIWKERTIGRIKSSMKVVEPYEKNRQLSLCIRHHIDSFRTWTVPLILEVRCDNVLLYHVQYPYVLILLEWYDDVSNTSTIIHLSVN